LIQRLFYLAGAVIALAGLIALRKGKILDEEISRRLAIALIVLGIVITFLGSIMM
jgi:hypothetical protein